MTRCVRLWQVHTVKELLRRLKAQFPQGGGGGDGPLSRADLDLAALGVAAAWHFRSAPSVHCMLGPLDARVKARAKQKPRVRQRLADQVRPVDVQVGPPPIYSQRASYCHAQQTACLFMVRDHPAGHVYMVSC